MPPQDVVCKLVDQLRGIPPEARELTCSTRQARLEFGLDADALEVLTEAGVQSAGPAGDRRFDYGDLHYLGLGLGTARILMLTIRHWAAGLRTLSSRPSTPIAIDYVPQLPDGIGGEGLAFVPDAARRPVTLRHNVPAIRVETAMRGSWPKLPDPAVRIAGEIAELDFCYLPTAVKGDTDLARRTGLADCWTAACIADEECRAAGLETRFSHGLLVSEPYSTEHSWTEVRSGDTWVPIDSLLLKLMRRFGGLDDGEWPWERSIGPVLLRLGGTRLPILESDAIEVTARLTTTIGPNAGS